MKKAWKTCSIWVKVPRYGQGMFHAVQESDDEYRLLIDGKMTDIYKTHCHQDMECRKATLNGKKAVADKIGQRKK